MIKKIFLIIVLLNSFLYSQIIDAKQLFNKKTTKVTKEELNINKSFYGVTKLDESSYVDIVTRFDGYITKLNANKKYMFIPKGYAHGYITLSNESIFIYQVDEYFNLEAMRSISFDDKDLNIDWKIDIEKVIVSDKDSIASQFKDVEVYKGDL